MTFAGFQEVCTPAEARQMHGFYIISSGTDSRGREACELWINTQQPYSWVKAVPQFVNIKLIRVLLATPTLLVVDFKQRHFQCRLIVGHAPNATRPAAAIREWHDELLMWHR
eukprot:4657833-Karenia_brevis.AAC.1